MSTNMMSKMPGADKFMSRMFRKADGVVWDLMSGKVGIKTPDGIATIDGQGADAQVSINMMDQFGFEIPAFAQSTPIAAVAEGDIIYFGSKEQPGWVIEKKGGVDGKPISFVIMRVNGTTSNWNPPKVQMLGLESGIMVLRSLMTMLPGGAGGLGQMQGVLLPMMMGGEENMDIEQMMPLMLMSQMGAGPGADGAAASGNAMAGMMQTMMMMKMFGGNKGEKGGKGPAGFFDN